MAGSVASDGSEGSGGGAPTGAAGGDLTGTYPNPTLVATGPGAGAIGGPAKIMRSVTLDAQGRVTTATATDLAAVTGVLKSTAGALAAATAGTDYSAGTSALATGMLKSTTATGALSIGAAGTDYDVDMARAYYKALAMSRLGLTAGDKTYGFIFDDFDKSGSLTSATGWINAVTAGGTVATRVSTTKGGVIALDSSATVNSRIDITSLQILVSALGTDKWHFVSRQKVTTTIVAAKTTCGSGLFNSAGTSIGAGVFVGNGNFRVQYDGTWPAGSYLDLLVAVDANFHVFEIYGKGDGKIYARIDEGAELNVTPSSNPTTGMYLISSAANGNDGNTQTMHTDFIGCLYPR